MGINIGLFASDDDQIQNFFGPPPPLPPSKKKKQLKMSAVMPFSFNAVELCIVIINEKPWTRAKEVCKALQYNKKTADIIKAFCSKENFAHKYQLSEFPAAGNFMDWPKYSRKDDY